MSRLRRTAIACAFAASLLGAAEDAAPPLPPMPSTTPLPPSAQAVPRDDDDALLQRIDQLISTRDQRISEMIKEGVAPDRTAGRTPRLDTDDATVLDVLRAHAQARTDLRKALEEAAARGGRPAEDPLDRGRPRVQAAQTGPLEALNQLAIAECYKDLAGSPDGSPADLAAGLAALQATDAAKLAESERPRLLYLSLWFVLESVRRLPRDAPDAERAKLLAEAREKQTELVNQFPASPLAQTAEALFAGLDRAATAP